MMTRRSFVRCLLALPLAWALPGAFVRAAESAAGFFRAVQMDDARTAKAWLDGGGDPNAVNPIGGEPALVLAVREGSMNVLNLLLAHPAIRVDAQAANGNTALMMAAFKRNRAAADALLAKGAAVNRPGWTPLHYAAASGDDAIAAVLLKRGAAIDARSTAASGAYTALMMAAREGHPDTVSFLLKAGADRKLQNSEGLTAAQIAARANHDGIAKQLDAR
jgi:ankyrin repeat protein